jgi:hypothetical protein
MNIKKTLLIVKYIILIYAIFQIGLGICEAYFINKYKNYRKEDTIQTFILWHCIINFFNAVSCIWISQIIKEIMNGETMNGNDERVKLIICPMFSIIISIISTMIYFGTSNEERILWQTNAPEYWIFIIISFVMMWIYIILIILTIIIKIYISYCKEIEHINNVNQIELQIQ